MKRKRSLGLVLGVTLLLAACDEQEGVRVYDAPKDEPIPRRVAADPNAGHDHSHDHIEGHGDAPPTAAQVAWQLPEGWTVSSEAKPMRFVTLLIGEGDGAMEVAVTVFPDDVGGPLANTNRWRQEIGLAPIGEDALPEQLVPLADDGSASRLFDQTGTAAGAPARMLAAMVPGTNQTWFAKLVGPPDAVEAQREAFIGFARTLPPTSPKPAGS